MNKPTFAQWVSVSLITTLIAFGWNTLLNMSKENSEFGYSFETELQNNINKAAIVAQTVYAAHDYMENVNFSYDNESGEAITITISIPKLHTKEAKEMVVYAAPFVKENGYATPRYEHSKEDNKNWTESKLNLTGNTYTNKISLPKDDSKWIYIVKTTFTDSTTWLSSIGEIPQEFFSLTPKFEASYYKQIKKQIIHLSSDIPYNENAIEVYDISKGKREKLEIQDSNNILYEDKKPTEIEVNYTLYNGKKITQKLSIQNQ